MSTPKTPKEVRAMLKQMNAMIDRKKKEFHRAAAEIIRTERFKAFARKESPTGERWPALKPKTIRRKKGEHATQRMYQKHEGGPSGLASARAKKSSTPNIPLADTGALRMPTVEADAKSGRVVMAKSRSEVVSSAGSIGKIHNEGAGKVPKREHWGIYPQAKEKIEKLYELTLKEIVKQVANG